MKKTPARIPGKLDSADREALVYWFIGVLFTLLPTALALIIMARQSKPLTVSDDEIMMLACLILLPTLLDYFRLRGKGNNTHTAFFTALILLLVIFSALYGLDKANERTEIQFSSVLFMLFSILFSFVAELTLREMIKMDGIALQKTLTVVAALWSVFVTVMGFLVLIALKVINRAGENEVSGSKGIKVDILADMVSKLNPDERTALEERLKREESRNKER